MRVLTNTNIIVDDFDYCKNFPKGTFIHFLSHFHADHYFGMSTCWNYGPVYCSEITKKLILTTFPKIPDIRVLEMNKEHTIQLNESGTKTVTVYLMDANHIPGAVMFLFRGYMGTILHTGDARFCDAMFEDPVLYPPEKRNKLNYKCSIHIDELIFDNTYLHPTFNFPTRDQATKMMINIIEKNRGKHVIIAMGALGKESMMVKLSEHFQTLVCIPEKKFKMLEAMNCRTDIFTTKKEEGWIEVISKKHRLPRLAEEEAKGNKDFIMVSIDFLMFEGNLTAPDGINYLVPYSQHSNYKELDKFVKSICPSILKKLVVPYENFSQFKNRPINNIGVYIGYLKNLLRGGKSAFRDFLKRYTQIETLSEDYKRWMEDSVQKELLLEVGITQNADPSLRKTRKKDPRLEELQKQFPDATLYDLEKQFFPSKKREKQSLYEISSHMMAVNNNQSLNAFLGMKAGAGKVVKGEENKKKVKNVRLYAKKKKNEDDRRSLRTFLSMNSFEMGFNPAADQELLCLLDKFVMPGALDCKSNIEETVGFGSEIGIGIGGTRTGDEFLASQSQNNTVREPMMMMGGGFNNEPMIITQFGPNEGLGLGGLNDSMSFSMKSNFV